MYKSVLDAPVDLFDGVCVGISVGTLDGVCVGASVDVSTSVSHKHSQ